MREPGVRRGHRRHRAGGDDFVWRDFAWQTTGTADLDLNGYHGTGPFRFRGQEYRAALERRPADGGQEPPPRRRVLLIGARVGVLAKLAAALRTVNIGADITRDAADVPPDELRAYGAVVFGRTVDESERAAVRAAFDRAGADVAQVDGLAPVVPLPVARTEAALDRSPPEQRRLTRLVAAEGEAGVEVTSTCRVQLIAYRLDRLRRAHGHEVFDGVLEPGKHRIPLDRQVTKGRSFLVARTRGAVLTAPMIH